MNISKTLKTIVLELKIIIGKTVTLIESTSGKAPSSKLKGKENS